MNGIANEVSRPKHMKYLVLGLLVLSLWDAPLTAGPGSETSRLWPLYQARDYFTLQEQVPLPSAGEPPSIAFLRASTEAAFGRYDKSNAILADILRRGADNGIEHLARQRMMLNLRTQFRYRDALGAIEPLLRNGGMLSPGERDDLENRARLLEALRDVPPQRTMPGQSPAQIAVDGLGRVAATVGNQTVRLVVDTGANFSVLSRSAALGARLEPISLNYDVGSSNGKHLRADLATGSLALGGIRVEHVVFLIFPDRDLRSPDGGTVSGLIGMPVLARIGAIRFSSGGSLVFGAPFDARTSTTLALADGDPIIRAQFEDANIVCRVDTGADRTVFYNRFYRRFANRLAANAYKTMAQIRSVAGATTLPVSHGRLSMTIAGRSVTFRDAPILHRDAAGNSLFDCNIGRDILRSGHAFTLDLGGSRFGWN